MPEPVIRPVICVATTDIDEMMAPGTERRMVLPRFDPEFVDFPHYIIRITERIWHDREVDLCLKWYADDCAIHTLAGPIKGAQTVVDNTWATLAAFPDRRLDGDNVIWSDEGDGSFLSSHLITSKMTNLGVSDFGPPTGRQVLVRTIADCLCRENRVAEEWLVRDNLALVEQLGFDPNAVAKQQAQADTERGRQLVDVLAPYHVATLGEADAAPNTPAAHIAVELLRARWQHGDAAAARALSDFRLNAWVPGGRFLYGPDQILQWFAPIRASFGDRARLRIEHIAEVPYLGEARDIAVRWSLAGWHEREGPYGTPSGAPLLIMAVTHFRIINGRVREDVTIWDDIAVMRQIAGAART